MHEPVDHGGGVGGRCPSSSGAGGSATAAGQALYCHPNTVRYRLRRVEELTGRSVDVPRAAAELTVALQALRVFPTPADGC